VEEQDWAGGPVLRHSGSNGMWYARIRVAPKREAAVLAATNCGGDLASRACEVAIERMISKYL